MHDEALDALKWDAAGLVSAVAQDAFTGELRMVAFANREAVAATLDSGLAHFWSRSRKQLWKKGESSGNTMRVLEVWADCDGDALLYLVDPAGPTCHTGTRSCFLRRVDASSESTDASSETTALPALERLGATLHARQQSDAAKSYTKSLLLKGAPKIAEKLTEEAGELGVALQSETDERVVSETADLLYHAMVGLQLRGLGLREVQRELARRFGVSGHEEKAKR